ncbi:MAG: DUF1638 domain-containing protein, partial [Firmicutes bacterium]|nr:DUF1638 domain-containing protein [Bacillota bacterium]
MLEYVNAAQKAMGTHWPVVVVDRSHHAEPAEMKQVVKETIEGILSGRIPLDPDSSAAGQPNVSAEQSAAVDTAEQSAVVDTVEQCAAVDTEEQCAAVDPADLTVLVAMGFCGGSWDHVSFPCRVVIPRTDDCISILLATDDQYIPNRKELGHLYLYESDPKDFSALHLLRDGGTADETYRGMSSEDLFRYWFGNYHAMDIIDTGLNPCYEVPYVEAAQKAMGTHWPVVVVDRSHHAEPAEM